MGQEHSIERPDWLLSSRRRRFRLGDLMVAVVMTAIGLAVISLPELTPGERSLLGAAVLSFLGLEWTQWVLAGKAAHQSHRAVAILRGILSALLPLTMFLVLVFLGLFYPQGVALLSLLIVIHVVYLTTWD